MFSRDYALAPILDRKSLFLLGPWQTGKSTFLHTHFSNGLFIDLLSSRHFIALNQDPGILEEIVRAQSNNLIIIDEIQRLPILLNEVHKLIESNKSLRFILTGSSARKLRKQGVNLLGGRASQVQFFPLTSQEITTWQQSNFSVESLLQYGGLPHVVTSKKPFLDLEDYIALYLKEEIQAEAAVRNLGNFTRFLQVAAITNGEQVIFTNIASDAQIPARTVKDYYTILEDTLIGRLLPSYTATQKRKAMSTPKFYFFDVGVAKMLAGRKEISRGTPEYGKALEHLIYCELIAYIAQNQVAAHLYYWRSLSKFEVDFIIELQQGEKFAIEVKSTRNVTEKHCHGLLAFAEDVPKAKKYILCEESFIRKNNDEIWIMPWQAFLKKLWNKEIF